MPSPRISFIGAGYVGLSTAVVFADKGYEVMLCDRDAEKVRLINSGAPPFYEPQLDELLKKAIERGSLRATTTCTEAVAQSDITFITVGTPYRRRGGIDLSQVRNAAHQVGEALRQRNSYHLVVVKSTVPPGTTENMVKPILEERSGKRCGEGFGLSMNPEFLREGSAIHDTLYPDRIVIGEYDKRSGDILENLYREFYGEKTPPILRTNIPTAELIKYASNAFLATKISFINFIARLCQRIPGADVRLVAEGMGLDKRIGPYFLNAGLGYGGSCLPKDLRTLIDYSRSLGLNPKLLKAVEDINRSQPYEAIEMCKKLLGDLRGKTVAVLGLAFKPNTDDMREAKSIQVIRRLLKEGAEVKVYDPRAMPRARQIFRNRISYASSAIECIKDADCCIIVTEWEEFKKLRPEDFISYMRQPILVDGRRIYDPKEYGGKLKYAAIGLGPSVK